MANNFVITYKLGNDAYAKVLDVLNKTYKVIIKANELKTKKDFYKLYISLYIPKIKFSGIFNHY